MERNKTKEKIHNIKHLKVDFDEKFRNNHWFKLPKHCETFVTTLKIAI